MTNELINEQANEQANKVQRFTGPNVRAVFADVRQALGPDAVVVRQYRQGGITVVEACAEPPTELPT